MSSVDFSNNDQLCELIETYFENSKINYSKDQTYEDNFHFLYNFVDTDSGLTILVGKTKELEHQIDVVSKVEFSSGHLEKLKNLSQDKIDNMIGDVFMWLTPREPDHFFQLMKEDNYEGSAYYVITTLFKGELTYGNFIRTIKKTVKSSSIARALIQKHLN